MTMKALGCEAGNYIGAAAFADTKNSLHNPEISIAAASNIVIEKILPVKVLKNIIYDKKDATSFLDNRRNYEYVKDRTGLQFSAKQLT